MATPNMNKLLSFETDAAFISHLNDCYEKVAKEHSASAGSWFHTRFRKGSRGETALGAGGGAATALGTTSGAVALAGVAVPSAVVGVSAAVAAGAATLFALPLAVTVTAAVVWGYSKLQHHEANKSIWKWWCDNCRDAGVLDAGEIVDDPKTVTEWLGWFGDEGIGNMQHLGAKLTEAKTTFDNNFRQIKQLREDLAKRIAAANAIRDPNQRRAATQRLRVEADGLALKSLHLGEDLQYLVYRLQRMLMYHQMLELTIRSLVHNTPELGRATHDAIMHQADSYTDLCHDVAVLSQWL